VLVALVTVIAGVVAGRVAGAAAARAATSAGGTFAAMLAGTVRGTVILVAVVVAMEQVGIQADVLVVVIAIVVGATLAGAGLAFGLGARTAVSNIIASYYVSQAYQVGQKIRVGGIDGEIVETTPTAVFVAGPHGRVMIPAKQFSEEPSVLLTGR
jgi:small-conductance mechanosensitive channel